MLFMNLKDPMVDPVQPNLPQRALAETLSQARADLIRQ